MGLLQNKPIVFLSAFFFSVTLIVSRIIPEHSIGFIFGSQALAHLLPPVAIYALLTPWGMWIAALYVFWVGLHVPWQSINLMRTKLYVTALFLLVLSIVIGGAVVGILFACGLKHDAIIVGALLLLSFVVSTTVVDRFARVAHGPLAMAAQGLSAILTLAVVVCLISMTVHSLQQVGLACLLAIGVALVWRVILDFRVTVRESLVSKLLLLLLSAGLVSIFTVPVLVYALVLGLAVALLSPRDVPHCFSPELYRSLHILTMLFVAAWGTYTQEVLLITAGYIVWRQIIVRVLAGVAANWARCNDTVIWNIGSTLLVQDAFIVLVVLLLSQSLKLPGLNVALSSYVLAIAIERIWYGIIVGQAYRRSGELNT